MSYDLKLTNGDISFGPDGNPVQVAGQAKLAQDIGKILLTKAGLDIGSPLYGSTLQQSLGQPFDFSILQTAIAKSVSEALNYLQSLELMQSTKQTLTYDEVIGSIDAVAVSSPSQGRINVQIAVTTVNGLRTVFSLNLT